MQQSVLPESDWPPSLGRQYIQLALIGQDRSLSQHRYKDVVELQKDYTRGDYDKILKYKSSIDLQMAFDKVIDESGSELPLKMLIDGAPGVGKTTLSRKASLMWAKGELLERYWLVLLLHLRESAISKAKTIDDLFYHEDPDLKCEVVKFVKERGGDGVLIIFDGFDELSLHERSEESLFLHISEGKILPKCAVVVTSRPWASGSLQVLTSIRRHIEVLGFTNEQVKVCIKQKLKDKLKAEELCTELKDRLDVASICQIPLNCSIVLYVYEQEGYSLPRTLTELYELFILHSLKRFIKRTQNSRAADRLSYLHRLPDPSKEHFKSLCSLAFKGLNEDKLVFSRDDVEEVIPVNYQELDVDLPVLDLMTSAKSYSSRGARDTYNFLHLMIQEFLSAYWISHYLMDTEKLHFFKEYFTNDRFRMVLLFLSGLTKLRFPDAHSIFNKDLWIIDHIRVCHFLYESENHSILKYLSENCVVSKSIILFGSRFDALVVSHFVAYSGCQWDLLKLRPQDVKAAHKFFCTPESVNTSIKETLIKFDPSPENMLPSFTLIETNKLNQNLMVINLLNKLAQIDRVIVHITICQDDLVSCRALTETLHTVFVGPHPLHSKCYTIKLDFLEQVSFNNDGCDRSPDYCNSKTKLCEALAECLAQNSFITHVTLSSVTASDISCIFTHLAKKDSVSELACFQVYNILFPSSAPCVPVFLTSLLNLISTNKSLKQLDINVPGLSHLICTQIKAIVSVLINNTSLQSLTMCNGLYKFERNKITKEMEFTNFPNIANLPLKNILGTDTLSPSTDSSDGISSFPPQAK